MYDHLVTIRVRLILVFPQKTGVKRERERERENDQRRWEKESTTYMIAYSTCQRITCTFTIKDL